MEKISGIIPANSRVTTVDLKSSGTARAGMPSFGREVGVSNLVRNAENRELAALANARHKEVMGLRDSKTDPHADIVKNMSDSFFMKKNNPVDIPNVNYGPGADLVAGPIKPVTIEMKSETEAISDIAAEEEPISSAVQETTFSPQGKEPSDDEPYMGQSLDVRA